MPVSVMCAPMIPMINDMELERLLEAAREAGARSAGYVLLRLPHEVAGLFEGWLEEHFAQRAAHVMSLVRQSRGGKDYDSRLAAACAAKASSPNCSPSASSWPASGWASIGGIRITAWIAAVSSCGTADAVALISPRRDASAIIALAGQSSQRLVPERLVQFQLSLAD